MLLLLSLKCKVFKFCALLHMAVAKHIVKRKPASNQEPCDFVPGYWPYAIFKLPQPATKACPTGLFKGIEYCFKKKSIGEPRSNRPMWGTALTLQTDEDPGGRVDLHIKQLSC